MEFFAISLGICYLTFGTQIGANIIDNIIMRNWKDKETKRDDPFFNPFGLTFPLFDAAADDPMTGFLKSEGNKELREKRETRRAKLPKPWFSISEFLTLPEMSRKTKSEGRKPEGGLVGGNTAETAVPNDKITQTGDLAQTKSPSNEDEGKVRKAGDVDENVFPPDHVPFEDDGTLKNQLEFDLRLPENHTATKGKTQSKFSFPRGLSDILIIFQKVVPKPKTHQLITSESDHVCDEYCHNGICEMRGPWSSGHGGSELEHESTMNTEGTPGPTASEMPHHKKVQFLGQYDRICILAIPIALAIGTLLFIFELRRIFKKMKKQSVLSPFEHQEC